ncbi:hypothetical protein L218DRAFT_308813 [Marasmius fiardii PR-910]|nr:hypothetical protein L218DRAFT_308813 [Marasmius fiardii PR-910]
MANTFNIKNNCGQFLSCQACTGQSTTDLFDKDDASGRQRWTLVPVPNAANTYNIKVAGGRDASCGVFLSTGAGCSDNYVDLFTKDDGSGRQQWVLNKVSSSSTTSSASPSSTSSAAGPPLPTDGPAVTLNSSVFYTVTLAKGKVDGCNPLDIMFSNRGCDSPLHDLYFTDDGSKNQYWRFVPVAGTNNVFNILSCTFCAFTLFSLLRHRTVILMCSLYFPRFVLLPLSRIPSSLARRIFNLSDYLVPDSYSSTPRPHADLKLNSLPTLF